MGRGSTAPVVRELGTRESKDCLDLRPGRFTYRQIADGRLRK